MGDTGGQVTREGAGTREQSASPPPGSVDGIRPASDLSDRKDPEQAPTESKRGFRQLADAIPHLVWTADRNGAHEYFNERWYEYTGLTFEESRGWGWTTALHREDLERTNQRWRESCETGGVFETEYRLRSAAGEYRWFLGRAVPIRDESGNITLWFGTCTDVDDQRRAEEALRLSRERFDLVIRSVDVGVWYCDLPHGTAVWNETARRHLGVTADEEVTIEKFYGRLHPDDRERVRAEIQRSTEHSAPYNTQYRVVCPDGEIRWIKAIGKAFRGADQRPARFDGVMIDITGEKRAEELLRESRERLQAALTASDTGTFRWNFRTGALEWDDRLRRIFGLPENAEIRDVNDFFERIHAEDRQTVAEATRRCAVSGEDFDVEFRVVLPDGSVRWLADKGRTFRGTDGRPEYLTGACVDITDRRNGEEAVRQAQKLESLGVLAGGIAHDFNNLLVGIMGNASMVEESLPANHPDRQRLQGIVRASERAADLTRQLLAYAGKGQFSLEAVNLSDLVRDINALIQTSIPRRVRLVVELAENLPMIEADRGQIQQVTMNLIINAAEAIPENHQGMVRACTFSRRYGRAALAGFNGPAGQTPGVYVGLEVEDTGTGMDEPTMSRIFDPFFTTKFTGRGLGLSAVQGIVRASRGGLQVMSKPGLGSRFTVLFPASTPAPDVQEAESGSAARGTGQTVLVVDDEDLVRETVMRALERYGYRVIPAADGQAGIEAFAEHANEIAAVLLDLAMPLMSGEEALARIRAMRPQIPVLLSSGYSEAEAVRRFGRDSLASFIQKPYTAARVAEKIAAVLSGSNQVPTGGHS